MLYPPSQTYGGTSMGDLIIDRRQELVGRLMRGLTAAADGSVVLLRGSLAEERADQYSDVDLIWELPDALFEERSMRVAAILAAIQPVASVRSDPDFQRSAGRRLFFVRFKDLPLFWRLDLEVYAHSTHRDPGYDVDNPAARGGDWSWPESALTNVVGAVKAHLRGSDVDAWELLERAFGRVGLARPEGCLLDAMLLLVQQCIQLEPGLASFGSEVLVLMRHVEGLNRVY